MALFNIFIFRKVCGSDNYLNLMICLANTIALFCVSDKNSAPTVPSEMSHCSNIKLSWFSKMQMKIYFTAIFWVLIREMYRMNMKGEKQPKSKNQKTVHALQNNESRLRLWSRLFPEFILE